MEEEVKKLQSAINADNYVDLYQDGIRTRLHIGGIQTLSLLWSLLLGSHHMKKEV